MPAAPDGGAPSPAEANRGFYAAFERRDLDAMSDVWEHSDDVVCVHPGWMPLRGWGRVAASFHALFTSGEELQFILTEDRLTVAGDAAWVTLVENIVSDGRPQAVAATNVFRRGPDGRWRMVVHHGGPIIERPAPG